MPWGLPWSGLLSSRQRGNPCRSLAPTLRTGCSLAFGSLHCRRGRQANPHPRSRRCGRPLGRSSPLVTWSSACCWPCSRVRQGAWRAGKHQGCSSRRSPCSCLARLLCHCQGCGVRVTCCEDSGRWNCAAPSLPWLPVPSVVLLRSKQAPPLAHIPPCVARGPCFNTRAQPCRPLPHLLCTCWLRCRNHTRPPASSPGPGEWGPKGPCTRSC